MHKSQLRTLAGIVKYIPASLHEYGPANGWRIEYFAMHPNDKELKRVRLRVGSIVKHLKTKAEKRRYIADVINTINAKLAGGWSPFFEGEDSRLYVPLKEVCNLFLAERKRDLRNATIISYKSFCKMLCEWADKTVSNIYCSLFNHYYAVRYLDYLYNERNVSATTYNNQIKMGRAFFNWAKEKCYSKENPFERIRTKRKEDKKRTIIPPATRKQVTDYLQSQNDTQFELVCNLVYSSLIRPKEICTIKINDINLAEKYICIQGENAKNHNTRHSALSENSIELIKKLIEKNNLKNDNYLIINNYHSTYKNQPMNSHSLSKTWDRLRTKLKLPAEMQLYSFRDTGIYEMLKSGIDNLSVMQHADHSDLSITTRYANHADKNLIRKINENVPNF